MGAKGFDSTAAFFIGGAFLLVIFVIIQAILNEKKRKDGIKNYCIREGLKYTESANYIPNCKVKLKLATSAYKNEYSVIMSGERFGIHFCILDFYYHTGKKNGDHSHTLCVLSKSGINFPNFYLRQELPMIDWLNEKIGGQDIDFKEDKDFSDKYLLQGVKEKDIREFFTQKVRNAFLYAPMNYFYEYEGFEEYFVVSQGQYLNIDERLELLANSIKVFTAIISDDTESNNI
jgi:hypothetical protein